MNWLILIIAGLCETAFAFCLGKTKLVDGTEFWAWIAGLNSNSFYCRTKICRMIMITLDTTNMCSHLQKKLFDEDGVYHHLWKAMQDDPELNAVVRSRQLHIYRNGKKVLVLAGKSAPKIIREDKICKMLV